MDMWRVRAAVEEFLTQLKNASPPAISDYELSVASQTLWEKYHDSYICCSDSDPIRKCAPACDMSQDSNCDDSWWDYAQTAVKRDDDENQYDVHLFVTGESNFADAGGGDVWKGETGFAWVGTAGGYDSTNDAVGRYQNAAIQEIGHAIINSDLLSDDVRDPEHALGTIRTENGGDEGPVTPMAVFYESPGNPCYEDFPEVASEGDCASDAEWNGEHTLEVTECTIDAVRRSLR